MYDKEKIENFQIRMEELIEKFDKKQAFELITTELKDCEDKYLTEFMAPLNFLNYEPVLDWIKKKCKEE
ncbi:hypothetical protein AAFN75_17920 [Algibacter sp. AS12]|uniref:hypothetical protein n=1 Tax=Algibacter sp. AS12 TaxID=3135773 RepID=UPI00398AB715